MGLRTRHHECGATLAVKSRVWGSDSSFRPLRMRFLQALPFAFGNDSIESVDDGGDGFEVFAEGAGDFGGRVIFAEGATEFKDASFCAGEFFDALVKAAAVCGNVFAKRDKDVAQENGHAGDGLGVNFAELRVVFGIMDEVNAEFLQQRAEVVFDFDAMEIHGDFEAGDRIGAKEDFVVLADVEQFNGEDVGGMAKFFESEELRRRLFELAGPPVDDAGEASEIVGLGGIEDAEDVQVGLLFVIFAARGRAVEDDGVEIVAGSIVEAAGELG